MFRCRAHFQFACEFKRDVENHVLDPCWTRVVNDVEDLNSSEGKSSYHRAALTLTLQDGTNPDRSEETSTRFLFYYIFFSRTECSPKYYVLYVVFLSIIFFVISTVHNIQSEVFLFFLYCTVYTEFVHHV